MYVYKQVVYSVLSPKRLTTRSSYRVGEDYIDLYEYARRCHLRCVSISITDPLTYKITFASKDLPYHFILACPADKNDGVSEHLQNTKPLPKLVQVGSLPASSPLNLLLVTFTYQTSPNKLAALVVDSYFQWRSPDVPTSECVSLTPASLFPGLTKFRILPRPWFSKVQSALFPKYMKYSFVFSGLALFSFYMIIKDSHRDDLFYKVCGAKVIKLAFIIEDVSNQWLKL